MPSDENAAAVASAPAAAPREDHSHPALDGSEEGAHTQGKEEQPIPDADKDPEGAGVVRRVRESLAASEAAEAAAKGEDEKAPKAKAPEAEPEEEPEETPAEPETPAADLMRYALVKRAERLGINGEMIAGTPPAVLELWVERLEKSAAAKPEAEAEAGLKVAAQETPAGKEKAAEDEFKPFTLDTSGFDADTQKIVGALVEKINSLEKSGFDERKAAKESAAQQAERILVQQDQEVVNLFNKTLSELPPDEAALFGAGKPKPGSVEYQAASDLWDEMVRQERAIGEDVFGNPDAFKQAFDRALAIRLKDRMKEVAIKNLQQKARNRSRSKADPPDARKPEAEDPNRTLTWDEAVNEAGVEIRAILSREAD